MAKVKSTSKKKTAVKSVKKTQAKASAKTAAKASKKTQKKSASKKTASNAVKELKLLINRLDDEGVDFLLRQAKVLIKNREIEEKHEKNLSEYNKNKTTVKRKSEDSSIVEVIEAEDGKSFVIVVNGYRNFFSLDEMRKLVKICHSADDETDAADRLFHWISRERSDVIKNSNLSGKKDRFLPAIFHCLVETYTVR